MPLPEWFHDIAGRVRNWGRWGEDDELGTINLVTPEARRRGAASVRSGRSFSLALPLSEAEGIQMGFMPGRVNPVRTMAQINAPLTGDTDGFCTSDDLVVMGLQCATHWDGLAHVSYSGRIWNGYPASTITASGAARCGIHRVRSLTSRGVLLDVARARGVDILAGGEAITGDDLSAAAEMAGVEVEPGDIVLVRTGQMAILNRGDKLGYATPAPGLSTKSAQWLRDHDVAAVATDNMTFEVYPGEDPEVVLPVHLLHLVDMGLTQGQNFVLDELAADCADDGVYSFLLEASPLPFTNAVGSPVNPVAVK